MDNFFNTERKYNVIYADPAWSYDDKANSGKRGASHKYDLMSDQDIYDLPVQQLTDENCVLFLWATFPKLQEALNTIKSWGFEYKTIAFNWIKTNKNKGDLFWGMGNWTRSNSEICLLGIKGKPKRVDAGVHSVIMSPMTGHSRKPHETRKRIVKLVGDIPRIELFSRNIVDGWDCWGNEENKIKIDVNKQIKDFFY